MLLKPGLKLIGAKTKIRQRLYDLFPKDYNTYVEPFLGTGGVLIGSKPATYELAYDINPYVINYYQVLQRFPEMFFSELKHELTTATSKIDFEEYKRMAIKAPSPIYQAIAFYIVTKTCINGIWRLNKKGECNSSFCGTFEGRGFFTEAWFQQVVERIKYVKFAVQDYKEVLNQNYADKTFIFIDPPYRACKTTYNGISFSDSDHVVLRNLLAKQRYAKWMLTINDDEFVRDLYRGFNLHTHEVSYSCSQTNAGRGKKPELIITNY
jgi:DNA adenine methylase